MKSKTICTSLRFNHSLKWSSFSVLRSSFFLARNISTLCIITCCTKSTIWISRRTQVDDFLALPPNLLYKSTNEFILLHSS